VLVEAPESQIIERLKNSNNWYEDIIFSILKIQENLYQNKSKIDYIFFNNSDEEKLKKQIEFFINTTL
jgi:dephospho-CoA kinase